VKACSTLGSTRRLGVLQLDEHQQSAGALDQCAHGTCIGLTLDEVALQVTRDIMMRSSVDGTEITELTFDDGNLPVMLESIVCGTTDSQELLA
jgi:hypothetical protein